MNEANTMTDITGHDETVEQEIQRKGLTAPRVTPADIEANIAEERCFLAGHGVYGRECIEGTPMSVLPGPLMLLTICVLVLRNGFTVVGTSACASPENFDAELGRKIAKQDAVRQIWPLMGYALRERLAGYERPQLESIERFDTALKDGES